MNKFLTKNIVKFIKDESGPTAVEYAVMLALIIIVCIASIGVFGQTTNQLFENSGNEMQRINGNN